MVAGCHRHDRQQPVGRYIYFNSRGRGSRGTQPGIFVPAGRTGIPVRLYGDLTSTDAPVLSPQPDLDLRLPWHAVRTISV